MTVAIDYTFSNGDPTKPESLHCKNEENDYIRAIKGVGSILENYAYQKKFVAYGFGGIPSHVKDKNGKNLEKKVSHRFPINGSSNDATI